MTSGSACGKIILFGEHAVVYGRPALAVPLPRLRARAHVTPRRGSEVVIHAPAMGRTVELAASPDDPLALITRLTLERLGARGGLDIEIESDIPIAGGLGSGAAVSTAIVRALAAHFGQPLPVEEISALVYQTERLYHGTPSGIDNTVIAYERPVRFVRAREGGGNEITPFVIARPFTLVIANTGIPSPTKLAVADVRRGWESDRARYEQIFDTVGTIVQEAQRALAEGALERLGELMTRNQEQLRQMGVSSPEIERLLEVGMRAGARGGKLSGGGRGGNVIFYAQAADILRLHKALDAEAAGVIVTEVK